MMKPVPGNIFPMATQKITDVYSWLSEKLSEIGLEEFHVRSIVAYFFMNIQDLEDESSQTCGVSPTSSGNGRRQAGFDVIPLQDRRKRCAELYIKNVSSKDSVPLAIVKKIVAELSTRLTTGTQDSVSACMKQDQETKSPELSSDSPVDRYNKAFPPLSEDNSPIHLSPPDDKENVWTQRRPLTSKLAGETSQKNGAIDRQPPAGTKADPPSRRTKTGQGKENDLVASGSSKKKNQSLRRREPIQYSSAARQLSYSSPHRPTVTTGSSEDEEKKSEIAEYLISTLGIKSSGKRYAVNNNSQPYTNAACTNKPSALRCQEKQTVDGSASQRASTQNQEARLPAHMFPEQLASMELSNSIKEKGSEVVGQPEICTLLKSTASPSKMSSRSAFKLSDASNDKAGATVTCIAPLQQLDHPKAPDAKRRPQVTITEHQRHMFAAFSPKDESLPSGHLHILPYELLDGEEKKKSAKEGVLCNLPNSKNLHDTDINTASLAYATDVHVFSSSLPTTLYHNQAWDNSGLAEALTSGQLGSPSGMTTLRESYSYPCLQFNNLDLASGSDFQQTKCHCFEDPGLCKHADECRMGQQYGVCFSSQSLLSSPALADTDKSDLPERNLEQWMEYVKSQPVPVPRQEHTYHSYATCQRCDAQVNEDPRHFNSRSGKSSSSPLSGQADWTNFTVDACGASQETNSTSSSTHTEALEHTLHEQMFISTENSTNHFPAYFTNPVADHAYSSSYLASESIFPSNLLQNLTLKASAVCTDEPIYPAAFDANTERRGVLCRAYSPLKFEDCVARGSQSHDIQQNYATRDDERGCSQSVQANRGEQFSLQNRFECDYAVPRSGDLTLYHSGIWSHEDVATSKFQSLFLVSDLNEGRGQQYQKDESEPTLDTTKQATVLEDHKKLYTADGPEFYWGQIHSFNSRLFRDNCSMLELYYWTNGIETPCGFGPDIPPNFYPDFPTAAGYKGHAHAGPPTTAYSSLPEEAGFENFNMKKSPSCSIHIQSSVCPQINVFDNKQPHSGVVFCEEKPEKFKEALFNTQSQYVKENSPEAVNLDAAWLMYGSQAAGQFDSQATTETIVQGVEEERRTQSQHSDQDSDPELQFLTELTSCDSHQWLPKQGLLGFDSGWCPSPSVESGNEDSEREQNRSSASVAMDPLEDTWFSPWLQAFQSSHNQSRLFPCLRDCSAKRPSPPSGFYLSPAASLQLDRSVSDSRLNIPSASSAFSRYVRSKSNSFPSLQSTTSCQPFQLPDIGPTDPTPRAQSFQPIPADAFGRPIECEVPRKTDAAPTKRCIYRLNPYQLSPPMTPDLEVLPDCDVRLMKKTWKEMQDVSEEDRAVDALYYYKQFGIVRPQPPKREKVQADLIVMEQVAARDFFARSGQGNGCAPAFAVPIPRHALRLEEVEEEMFQSSAHGGHRSRRKPHKGSSKAKQPRGGSHSKKPCSFYLEGQCYRADCKYSHDMATITCCFWQAGECFKGDLCPFLHGYAGNDERGDMRALAELVPPVVELSSEDFPKLSAVAQDVSDHSTISQKNVKKSGVRSQVPRGN